MKLIKYLLAGFAALALASCGGGGGSAGTPGFGGGGGGGGGGGTPVPTASDLILDTSAAQIANTSSGSVAITVTVVDATRVVVAGVPVSLSADADTILSQSSPTTNETGQISGTLRIGGNRANRLVTITATSGSIVRTAQLQVVGSSISSTLVPAVVAPGATAEIQYRVVDQTGNPMVGQAVSVSSPGLTPATASGTSGSNGEYTFSYTAPTAAGSYEVATSIAGVTDRRTVTVQSASTVPPVTATISSASVSANPSVVGVNTSGSSSNRSEIRALFLTSDNRPVPNVRVRFDLAGDVNSIGGSFSTGSSILYSDANGVVTTAYVPGGRASPTDGVTIRACYGNSDTDPALLACTTSSTVRLTVVSDPLGVSIGTNETIVVGELTYTKRFLVSVADSAGNAKADVPLSVSLDLPQYRKGRYVVAGDIWMKLGGGDAAICLAEDGNRNGVLETGEDVNGSGRLDPGRSDVTVRLLSSRTGADGTAVLEITYAKSFGTWVDAWITVSASGVSGTEGRATYKVDPIPVDAASIGNVDVPPAYRISPYGESPSCADAT